MKQNAHRAVDRHIRKRSVLPLSYNGHCKRSLHRWFVKTWKSWPCVRGLKQCGSQVPKIKVSYLLALSPVQTDAILLANNSQHCWMLQEASCLHTLLHVAPCRLRVVGSCCEKVGNRSNFWANPLTLSEELCKRIEHMLRYVLTITEQRKC